MEGNMGVLRANTYDAIVIGTSWGDRLLPMAFAQAGQKVALVERGHLGGTCVNTGCTPTKTMVTSARVAYLARRGADYGVHAGPISVAMPEVRQRKQGIVEGARSRVESLVTDVDLLLGTAHFIAPRTLEVQLASGETRGFKKAIVDAETRQILGCAILGLEGGEIMAIIQTAMMGKLPYTALRDGIFTHPTLAEGLNSLFTTLDS